MTDIILGSGVSGLIANNILDNVTDVFEKESKSGGDFTRALGPKYVHFTEETQRFFSKFEFQRIEAVEIPYDVYAECFIHYNEITDDTIQKYNKNMGYNFSSSMNRNGQSVHKGFFLRDLDFLLTNNIRYNTQIVNIDLENKKVFYIRENEYREKSYDRLISTINLFNFIDLCSQSFDYLSGVDLESFKSNPVIYADVDLNFNDFFDSYFFYNLDTSLKFFRCTKRTRGVILEFIYDSNVDYNKEVKKFLNHFNLKSCNTKFYFNKYGKVYSDDREREHLEKYFESVHSVHFIGRNSSYSHDRIQDVIRKLEKLKNAN